MRPIIAVSVLVFESKENRTLKNRIIEYEGLQFPEVDLSGQTVEPQSWLRASLFGSSIAWAQAGSDNIREICFSDPTNIIGGLSIQKPIDDGSHRYSLILSRETDMISAVNSAKKLSRLMSADIRSFRYAESFVAIICRVYMTREDAIFEARSMLNEYPDLGLGIELLRLE